MTTANNTNLTPKQQRAYAQVQKFLATNPNATLASAIKSAGVSYMTYHVAAKKKNKLKTNAPSPTQATAIATATSDRLIALVGSPNDVVRSLKAFLS